MKIINKTLKKLSQTMMLSFLLAPIFISSTQAFADSVGGGGYKLLSKQRS